MRRKEEMGKKYALTSAKGMAEECARMHMNEWKSKETRDEDHTHTHTLRLFLPHSYSLTVPLTRTLAYWFAHSSERSIPLHIHTPHHVHAHAHIHAYTHPRTRARFNILEFTLAVIVHCVRTPTPAPICTPTSFNLIHTYVHTHPSILTRPFILALHSHT